MRVLSFDPGAVRMGWACLERKGRGDPVYKASGIYGVVRGEKKFQQHRMEIVQFWATQMRRLLISYQPDRIISEVVPAVGSGKFVVATQSYLVNVAITTIQAVAYMATTECEQIGASTVKKKIGKAKDASKVKVRNGVYELLPQLRVRHNEWTDPKAMDESDAIAIGLAGLGYVVR